MQPPAHGTVITTDNILAPLIPTIFLSFLCALPTIIAVNTKYMHLEEAVTRLLL